jgi:hypothetical protein
MQDSDLPKFKPGVVAQLEGMRFGNLTVTARGPDKQGGFYTWVCRCTCGSQCIVSGAYLRRGKTKSCNLKGHRWKNTPRYGGLTVKFPSEYASWRGAWHRCYNPKNISYPVYGGRGITVCDRWKSFEHFMQDMGRKPEPKFTIERRDVNGNYEPGNCCWISKSAQGRNKQNSVYVVYQGRKMLLIDLIEELGLSKGIVKQRLKLGWTLAQAIALPNGSSAWRWKEKYRKRAAELQKQK